MPAVPTVSATFPRGRFELRPAWTVIEIQRAVEDLLDAFADRLPGDRGARVVIKPNLNNDLVALVGNCADLRVLCSLIEGLRARGFHRIAVADGSNVGVDRRGIDSFKRLRVDRLRARYGIEVVDLNRDAGLPIDLHAGARPLVARTVLEADLLISVPKVKTHAEAGFSGAMKNWVGICRGQQKRDMHLDLARNIFAINEAVRPHLVIVDGLVGMEGNGPGDGDPFRLGLLAGCDDAFLNDLCLLRLVGFPWREVGYMGHARDAGIVDDALAAQVEAALPVVRPIRRAPPRSLLAVLSEKRALHWLKRAVRPLVDQPAVAEAAYRAGIIQDVYGREDDTITRVSRNPSACGECRKCQDFCPTFLTVDEIGVKTGPTDCIGCLYCWWVCPKEAITLHGDLNAMRRQVERYKRVVEAL